MRRKKSKTTLEYSLRKRKTWKQIQNKFRVGQKPCTFGVSEYTIRCYDGKTKLRCSRCNRIVTIPKNLRLPSGWYARAVMPQNKKTAVRDARLDWFKKLRKQSCGGIPIKTCWPSLNPKDLKNVR